MNEKPEIEVGKLPVITKFIYTLGVLPTSYLMSMTYQEQVTWLYNYLQTQVIPLLNTESAAIQELQNLYELLRTYVNDYFDNLDVQEEINNKIDSLVEDGTLLNIIKGYIDPIYQAYENQINFQINEIDTKVNSAISGNPIPVSSISQMTDTSKTYLLTSDGYWYYYNGSAWVQGAIYQASGIADKSIYPYMTTFLETKNILPYTGWISEKVYNGQGAEITYSGSLNREKISIQAGKKYIAINNNNLILSDLRVLEFDSNDSVIKQTNLGVNLNHTFTTDANTSYVKFTSYGADNTFTILPINSMYIVSLDDLKEIQSFSSVFEFNDNNKQTIKPEEIFIENPYRFRLVPMIYRSNYTYDIANLKYPSVYRYKNKITATGSTIIHGTYLYADNVTENDYLFIDTTGSDIEPTYVNIYYPTYSGGNYNKPTQKVKTNLFSIKLDDIFVEGLQNGDVFFGCRFSGQSGQIYNVEASAYINYDFTNILNFIQTEDSKQIKFILLGDSITHLGGDRSWFRYFSELINTDLIANVAVDGAHLKDYEDTIYDGNPSDAKQSNNVLGNQVQKILNNNYSAPDVIMIAIGTNGGINTSQEEINNAYLNGIDVKPLEDVDRTTDAGAFRYCNDTLHNKYPNAIIIWCTPIIASSRSKTTQSIISWGDNLKLLCDYGSNYCFDTANCGISMTNQTEYLYDGLHPNEYGAKKMGAYNACEFKKLVDRF